MASRGPAYPGPSGTIRPQHVGRVYVEIPLFSFGVAVILATLVPGIIERPSWGLTNYSAAALAVVILLGVLNFLWADFVQLSAALTPEALYLPFYVPPPLRTRRRTIPLSELADAVPDLDGVDLSLKDGTRIFLDHRYFGRNGTEVVSRLSARVGKSYREAVDIAVGKELMQVTISGKSVKADRVYLNRPLFSYSGLEVRNVSSEDLVDVRRFKTVRGTTGFRLELSDRSPFFLSDLEIERLRLRGSPGWASRLSSARPPTQN